MLKLNIAVLNALARVIKKQYAMMAESDNDDACFVKSI